MRKNHAVATLVGSAIGFVGLVLTISAPASATADCPQDMHWCVSPSPVAAGSPNVLFDGGTVSQ
jgi:hypothetical protein